MSTPATAPAPAATAPAKPAEAPAPSPANATPDINALVSKAVESQVAPLMAELTSAREKLAAIEADRAKAQESAASAVAAKVTVEQQLAQLQTQFAEDRSRNALALAVDRYQYASPQHREHAMTIFRAGAQIQASGADVVALIGGKAKPIAAAYDEWFAANGAMYKATAAQPGPSVPPATAPDTARKPLRELTDEEFAALKASGVRGTLTNDRNAPVFEIKSVTNPFLAKREQMLSLASGRSRKN